MKRALVVSMLVAVSYALFTPPMMLAPVASAQGNLRPRAPRIEAPQFSHPLAAPQVTFESARVVHRVKHNNKWWMRIHVKFRIKNALSTPCKIYAYFYDDDGEPLEAGDDPRYRTTQGYVYAAGADFTPGLNDAVYKDFLLYIPYEALNLETEPGSLHDLKFFLNVRDEYQKRVFAKSGWYQFSVKY